MSSSLIDRDPPLAPLARDQGYRYWAFISYNQHDELWANWLHRSLETYRIPKALVGKEHWSGTIPKRLFPVFRDRDELASAGHLGDELRDALAKSRALIVVCSPNATRSRWVDEEIRSFKAWGRDKHVLALISDGEPNCPPDEASRECFPEALRFRVTPDSLVTKEPSEPIAADVRKGRDGRKNAQLKLIAGILGIGFDLLKRREQERRMRQLTIAGAVLLMLAVAFAGVAYVAFMARNEAERQTTLARAAEARATAAAQEAEKARQAEQQQRKKAESNFHLAKQTVDESFSGVEFDLQKLPGAEVYRLALLKKARAYYMEFLKERQGGELDLDHAKTILNLALIELELGGDAGPRFAEATSFLDKAIRKNPNDFELRRHLFLSQLNVGVFYLSRNQPTKAASAFRAAIVLGERLRRTDPRDRKLEMDTRLAENHLGSSLLNQNKLEEGIGLIEKAKAGFESLRQEVSQSTRAGDVEFRDQIDSYIAGTSFNLASVGTSGLPLARRIDNNRAAWWTFEDLFRRDSTSNERAFRVAQACRLMAALLLESGDAGEAEIYAERSFLIQRKLAKLFPSNLNYSRESEADLRFLTASSPTWKQELWFHEAALKILERVSDQGLPTPDGGRGLKHRLSIAHLSIAVNLLKPVLLGRAATVSEPDSLRAKGELQRANALNEELLKSQDPGRKREIYIVMKLNYPMWLELNP